MSSLYFSGIRWVKKRSSSSCVRLLSEQRLRPTHFGHCFELVRKHDYENFLTLLLLPEDSRAGAVAVRAFNAELAQIRDTVSERQLGLMRIQFWKETLDKIFANSSFPASPVSLELAKAIKTYRLTRRWLDRMIAGREDKLLSDAAFSSCTEIEEYAEKCSSSVLYLILECLSVKSVTADHAASHVGKAQGIATLIRATPYHAQRNRVYLPTDLMVKHGISQEEVTRACREQKMKDLVYELASDAYRHLNKATSLATELSKPAKLALLPAVTTRSYLKALERADFDVFDSKLTVRNNWLPLSLWISKIKNRI